jgi:hypothetical protein
MLAVRATFENGTSGLEAGIAEMLERMQGRLKVFATLIGNGSRSSTCIIARMG